MEKYKKTHNNAFKISSPARNEKFELPDGSYSVLFRVYLKKPKRTD